MRRIWVASLVLTACAHAPEPCPVTPAAPGASVVAAPVLETNVAPTGAAAATPVPSLSLLLRPMATPSPVVHVELEANVPMAPLTSWTIARGSADRIASAAARDGKGAIAVQVTGRAGGGVDLVLARAPEGAARLAYDVKVGEDAPLDPLGQLVQDDRFRGAGESLVALPPSIEATTMALSVRIDGEPLRVPNAASSLGVGGVRRTRARPGMLRASTFVAGSMGGAVFDDPAGNHDEAAWLGYTSFDPRPAAAELAQIRGALGELFKSHDEPPWTYLIVAQSRSIGSFTTTPRADATLLQLGPSEPWSAPIRLSMAQLLARRWIGGAVHVGEGAAGTWFSEGVARYVATRTLARLGLLRPDDVREAIVGELTVMATSPYAREGNAALAARAATDGVARATLTARGALYAARESAVIRGRSLGARGLDDVVVPLVYAAEETHAAALTPAAWVAALAKDDPDAAKSFESLIVNGQPIALPATALAPCFRAGQGEYVAFDAGFDVDASRIEKDGRAVGVREGGPAAKAGLREGDVLESMSAREGDASAKVTLVVTQGAEKKTITYVPRGAHGKGQTWTRVRGIADERCADLP